VLTACALSLSNRPFTRTCVDLFPGPGRQEAAGAAIPGEFEVIGASTGPGFPIVGLLLVGTACLRGSGARVPHWSAASFPPPHCSINFRRDRVAGLSAARSALLSSGPKGSSTMCRCCSRALTRSRVLLLACGLRARAADKAASEQASKYRRRGSGLRGFRVSAQAKQVHCGAGLNVFDQQLQNKTLERAHRVGVGTGRGLSVGSGCVFGRQVCTGE
jgi:hypothetical protein